MVVSFTTINQLSGMLSRVCPVHSMSSIEQTSLAQNQTSPFSSVAVRTSDSANWNGLARVFKSCDMSISLVILRDLHLTLHIGWRTDTGCNYRHQERPAFRRPMPAPHDDVTETAFGNRNRQAKK
jgi:hypothetical protein